MSIPSQDRADGDCFVWSSYPSLSMLPSMPRLALKPRSIESSLGLEMSIQLIHARELNQVREDGRRHAALLQEARDTLAEEYEDLYDAHQVLTFTVHDAEVRQDEDAKALSARDKRCQLLEAEALKNRKHIEEMENVMAAGNCADQAMKRRVGSASVLWWRERCRSGQKENQILLGRLAQLSEEVCPMLCDRVFTHSMQCCRSKICATCLDQWRQQGKSSCPYCRACPATGVMLDRPGTSRNPITIV